MTGPPFPVPTGMQWDPEKKRFFKAASYKAAIKGEDDDAEARHKRNAESMGDTRALDEQIARTARPSAFASRNSGMASTSPAGKNTAAKLLMSAQTRSYSSEATRRLLSSSRLHTIVTVATDNQVERENGGRNLDPDMFDNIDGVDVVSLDTSCAIGSILFFRTSYGAPCCLDLARMSPRGSAPLYDASSGFSARPRHDQMPFSAEDASRHAKLARDGPKMIRFSLFLIGNSGRQASHFEAALSSSHFAELFGIARPLIRLYKFTRSAWQIRHFESTEIRMLSGNILADFSEAERGCVSVRTLPTTTGLLSCDGESRGVLVASCTKTVVFWRVSEVTMPHSMTYQGAAKFTLTSDILCHDIMVDGEAAIIGCRDGTLHYCQSPLESMLNRDIDTFERKIATTLPIPGHGAVTNIKCVSTFEVLVAYSSGQLKMVSVRKGRCEVVMKYEGHFNRWTLDAPLAVDEGLRVFALAGQDKRVRIWHFDQASPLTTSSTREDSDRVRPALSIQTTDLAGKVDKQHATALADTVFSDAITGLAFIPRESVRKAEGDQNVEFLARGIPALAVTCGGSRIAIFE